MKIKTKNNGRAIGFKILQVDFNYDGLKNGKNKFKKSQAASPLFGSDVLDKFSVNDVAETYDDLDTRKNYDFARSQKKITDEELIAKYGTKYPEFNTITKETRKQVLGEDVTIGVNKPKEEITKDDKPEFSFIKDASEVSNSKEEVVDDKPAFNFDQFKTPEVNSEVSDDIDESFGVFKPKFTPYVEPVMPKVFPKMEEVEKKEENINHIDSQPKFNEVRSVDIRPNGGEASSDFNGPMPHEEVKNTKTVDIPKIVDPYKDYVLPPLDIFKKGSASSDVEPEWLNEKKEIINQTLQEFGVMGEVIKCVKGPTFSRYEVSLQAGVSVKKVSNLEDNLQMSLGAKSIRIQAPIPGKRTVGIEVPNDKAETVYFGDIVNEEFIHDGKPLNVALGKDIDNNSIYTKINSWPHGLIAGSTGSGKSVCMNTILISLLLKNKPDDVKLLLVDPKTVELMSYNELPHLVTPVINDPALASEALKWACEEMDRRYMFLNQFRVRNIGDYNEKAKTHPEMQKLPFIVIVIDELADLMLTASADVEESIMRITAKARAAGIHLLVATQRPTTDVVKGTIKANISTRVAFRTTSNIDSQTILDEGGAEKLLGKGDMFLKVETPARLQGAFVTDAEIDAVTDFIRAEAQPDYLFSHDDLKKKVAATNAGGVSSNSETPEMLYNVALHCINNGICSINNIQGSFQLGFNRAQRIIQALEELGIVGPKDGTKGRPILKTASEVREILGIEE